MARLEQFVGEILPNNFTGQRIIYDSAASNILFEEWYVDGKLQRELQPARIGYMPKLQEWYQDGKLHRIDGPARCYSQYGNLVEEFYLYGQCLSKSSFFAEKIKIQACVNGTQDSNYTGIIVWKGGFYAGGKRIEYFRNGTLHRLNGAARYDQTGQNRHYFINGVELNYSHFEAIKPFLKQESE